MGLEIKPIRKIDLEILYQKMFDKHVPWLHGKNLADQEKGNSLWLIAWLKKEPIAHLQITFKKPHIQEIKKQIKKCPHLSTLYVKEKYRKRGIAKELIKFAENLIRKKGYKKIGLSVVKDDKFLNNFYNKLGYHDWGKGIVIDSWKELENGKLIDEKEKCNYLIKKLK